jgi:hypothetical protein
VAVPEVLANTAVPDVVALSAWATVPEVTSLTCDLVIVPEIGTAGPALAE